MAHRHGEVRMPKVFYASLAFLNFFPLWMTVMFLDCKALFFDHVKQNGTEWCGLCGCCIGMLVSSLVVLIRIHEKKDAKGVVVSSIDEKKVISADVLLTYVLPLLAFDFGSWVGMVQFLLFFIVIIVLQVRHNAITGNVFLGLLGYRFYDCKYYNEESMYNEKSRVANVTMIIAKRYLEDKEGAKLNLVFLNDQVTFDVNDDSNQDCK